ncbi:hypothetical protein ACX8XP_19000 [Calditrichota bacterium LG25]
MVGELVEWSPGQFKVPKGRNDYSETVSTVYANEHGKKSFIVEGVYFNRNRL